MSLPLDRGIRAHLRCYLAGTCTLEEFEDWFVPHALSVVEEAGNPAAEELAYEIELRLVEFSDGGWTEEELQHLLRPLVDVNGPSGAITPSRP